MCSNNEDFSGSVCSFSFVSLISVHNFTASLDRHSDSTLFPKAYSENLTKILVMKGLTMKRLHLMRNHCKVHLTLWRRNLFLEEKWLLLSVSLFSVKIFPRNLHDIHKNIFFVFYAKCQFPSRTFDILSNLNFFCATVSTPASGSNDRQMQLSI